MNRLNVFSSQEVKMIRPVETNCDLLCMVTYQIEIKPCVSLRNSSLMAKSL